MRKYRSDPLRHLVGHVPNSGPDPAFIRRLCWIILGLFGLLALLLFITVRNLPSAWQAGLWITVGLLFCINLCILLFLFWRSQGHISVSFSDQTARGWRTADGKPLWQEPLRAFSDVMLTREATQGAKYRLTLYHSTETHHTAILPLRVGNDEEAQQLADLVARTLGIKLVRRL